MNALTAQRTIVILGWSALIVSVVAPLAAVLVTMSSVADSCDSEFAGNLCGLGPWVFFFIVFLLSAILLGIAAGITLGHGLLSWLPLAVFAVSIVIPPALVVGIALSVAALVTATARLFAAPPALARLEDNQNGRVFALVAVIALMVIVPVVGGVIIYQSSPRHAYTGSGALSVSNIDFLFGAREESLFGKHGATEVAGRSLPAPATGSKWVVIVYAVRTSYIPSSAPTLFPSQFRLIDRAGVAYEVAANPPQEADMPTSMQPETSSSTGNMWLIRDPGLVATNWHLIFEVPFDTRPSKIEFTPSGQPARTSEGIALSRAP